MNRFASARDPVEITVAIEAGAWPGENELLALTRNAVMAAAAHLEPTEKELVSVLFTDNAEIQSLNARFRGKDQPTNVLSFPVPDGFVAPDMPRHMGDIALGYEVVRDEAEAEGKSFQDHLTHLILHGYLHLCGYDHENASEAEEMEQLEREILKSLAIGDPYA